MSAEAGLARMTVLRYLEDGKLPGIPKDLPPELMKKAAVFVSIKKEGRLRGCIGTFEPLYPSVAEEIMQNALRSAISDPRFAPLTVDEFSDVTFSVDVLGSVELIQDLSELDSKKYGVLVRAGERRGLLLPDLVGVDTVSGQIVIAKQKAGMEPEEICEIYRFLVKRYSEE